jgi:hypothetical protein
MIDIFSRVTTNLDIQILHFFSLYFSENIIKHILDKLCGTVRKYQPKHFGINVV